MTDQQTTQQTDSTQSSAEAWREVGKQFEIMGTTLAQAFQSAWRSEGNRERAQEMQAGLETMVQHVSNALNESLTSPQGQHARAEMVKAAESFRTAGEHTVQEIRPHLLYALNQLNEELKRLVSRFESEKPAPEDKASVPPAGNGSTKAS
jgi:hypothetical protein